MPCKIDESKIVFKGFKALGLVPEDEWFLGNVEPLVLKGFIPEALCKAFIEANAAKATKPTAAPRGKKGAAKVVADYRNDETVIKPEDAGLLEALDLTKMAAAVNKHWGTKFSLKRIKDFPAYLYSVFNPGQYCRNHHDIIYTEGTFVRPDRRLSMIAYMNSWSLLEDTPGCFTGGELVFSTIIDDYGNRYSFQPEAGDVIIFPANTNYYHCVQDVTSGQRHTVVSFLGVDRE